MGLDTWSAGNEKASRKNAGSAARHVRHACRHEKSPGRLGDGRGRGARAIQQLVFADVEGQRHQESMDMTQKQYAAQTNSVLIQQQMLDQQRKANAGDNPPTPTE